MLTPAELAAHLRTSERTVSRMVIDGCPSMLVGRRRRFDLAAVTTWITERAACQSEKTPQAAGMQRHLSAIVRRQSAGIACRWRAVSAHCLHRDLHRPNPLVVPLTGH